MTKATPTLTTDVQATLAAQVAIATQAATAPAEATPSAVQPRPGQVVITDQIHIAMGAAAVLIRQGYIPFDMAPPEVYLHTGYATITLCLGNPDERAIKAANEAMEVAEAIRQREFDKEVKETVQRQLEQTKRDNEKAVLLAQIAEQESAIDAQRLALRRLQSQAA